MDVPMIKMAVRLSDRTLETFNFSEETIKIGRDSAGDVFLDNPAISRHHVTVYLENGKLMVKDQGSANGTFLNGSQVNVSEMKNGDIIGVGKFKIVVGYSDPDKAKPVLNYGGGTLAIDSSVVENLRNLEKEQEKPAVTEEITAKVIEEKPPIAPPTPTPTTIAPKIATQVFTQNMVEKTNPTPYIVIAFLIGAVLGFVIGMKVTNDKNAEKNQHSVEAQE
jgi:pSer/pThr/pTyr-binding forkhead associated (FHA) protein